MVLTRICSRTHNTDKMMIICSLVIDPPTWHVRLTITTVVVENSGLFSQQPIVAEGGFKSQIGGFANDGSSPTRVPTSGSGFYALAMLAWWRTAISMDNWPTIRKYSCQFGGWLLWNLLPLYSNLGWEPIGKLRPADSVHRNLGEGPSRDCSLKVVLEVLGAEQGIFYFYFFQRSP